MLTENLKRVTSRLMSVKNYNDILFTEFRSYKTIVINGVIYKNPLEEINSLLNNNGSFVSRVGLCISGDPILDNFIIKNDEFAFIDSRGEDLIWEDELPLFDPYYDLYFFGWKQIREEQFSLKTNNYSLKNTICNFSFTGYFKAKYEQFSNESLDIIMAYKDLIWRDEDVDIFRNKIRLLAGMHFLSDTFPRIVGKGKHVIDQCFLEYILGTKLINESVKNLHKLFNNNSI